MTTFEEVVIRGKRLTLIVLWMVTSCSSPDQAPEATEAPASPVANESPVAPEAHEVPPAPEALSGGSDATTGMANALTFLVSSWRASSEAKELGPRGFTLWKTGLDGLQPLVEPVRDALDAYRADFGAYPDSLEVLVESGELSGLPELPRPPGALRMMPGLRYQVAPDGSFYVLGYTADFVNGLLPELVQRWYVSDTRHWGTNSYWPTLETLVASKEARLAEAEAGTGTEAEAEAGTEADTDRE